MAASFLFLEAIEQPREVVDPLPVVGLPPVAPVGVRWAQTSRTGEELEFSGEDQIV